MHTIDLLRGEGIPLKTTVTGTIVAVVAVLVPLCATAAIVDRYFKNEAIIEIRTHILAGKQNKLDSYSEAVKARAALEREQTNKEEILSEVSTFANKHIQWSPILITLAEHMPEGMIITSLEAVRKNIAVILPRENDPNTSTRVTVPKRSLVIDLAGRQPEDHDLAVMNLRDTLAKSAELGAKLEDVVTSQGAGNTAVEGTVSYEVICVFEEKR